MSKNRLGLNKIHTSKKIMTKTATDRILLVGFRLLLFCWVFFCVFSPCRGYAGELKGIEFKKAFVEKVGVNYIVIEPEKFGGMITPAFPQGYSEKDSNFPTVTMSKMVQTYKPVAVINGTFFDAGSFRTVCSVVVGGVLVCEGDRGSTFYLDRNGKPGLLLTSRLRGRNIKWKNYQWAIQGGPTLLFEGKTILNPSLEGFSDPNLFRATRRTAIGCTQKGEIILLATNSSISLNQLTAIMKKLGCTDAINLDGGTSSGMYYEGKYPLEPGRNLSNFIMVFADKKQEGTFVYPPFHSFLASKDRSLAMKYKKRGDELFHKKQYLKAASYYVKACKVKPDELSFIALSAQSLKLAHQPVKASKYYAKAGFACFETGNMETAYIYIRQAIKLDPKNNYARELMDLHKSYPTLHRVYSAMARKNYIEAYYILMDILPVHSTNPRLYFTLGRCLEGLELIELKSLAYYLSSIYFSKMTDREYEAFISAKHSVESSPHNRDFRLNLSFSADKVGDKTSAQYHKYLAGFLTRGEYQILDFTKIKENFSITTP